MTDTSSASALNPTPAPAAAAAPAPAEPATAGAKLYDEAPAAPGGDTQTAADTGADTASGPETQSGSDTASGSDTQSGTDSQSGADAFEFKTPEGAEVDKDAIAAFSTLAQEVGLQQDGAQRLLDFYFQEVGKLTQAQETAFLDQINAWKAEIEKDPDLGGSKAAARDVVIGRALDQFGSPEARAAFDATGAGWNPAIVKFVHNMAKRLDEGGPVPAPGPRTGPRRGAAALYGDSN